MNLKNYVGFDQLIQKKSNIKKIFFYRICGTGMGAAACLLKEAGYDVEGADFSFYPPMSDYIKQSGIKSYTIEELDDEFYQKFDLIVVGNSLAGASKNASFVEELGVPFTSFPECLGAFVLKNKSVIGITGTHGKTTTTYFMSQILEKLGEKSGYLIGGVLADGKPSSTLGESKYFVIESDEYDSAYFKKISKFRLYEIDHVIITSLEFDHGDIFNSIDDIEDEFRALLKQDIKSVIANDSFESITKLKKEFKNLDWIDYGFHSGLVINETKPTETSFELKINNEAIGFKTSLVGTHNILNLVSCILFLLEENFNIQDIKKAVESLNLVKRRQEVRGHYQKSIVIDDFAHHPRAVALTLDGIRNQYPNKKLITVFEPISSTARSNIFQKEFAASFENTDTVIIANAQIKTTVKKGDNLDYTLLKNDIEKFGNKVYLVDDLNNLRKSIDSETDSSESILLILSNRTCLGLWESDFVNQLS